MDDVFHFSKKRTPDEQIELAEGLLDRAARPDCDPDERFVLLGKAAEAARDGGDAALMLRAVDARAERFEVDVLAERLDMLKAFAKGAKDPGSIRSLMLEVEPVLEQAARADRYDDAAELARAIQEACARPQGEDFRELAGRLHEESKRLREQYRLVQRATEKLADAPTDGGAHLVLGRWHCFERDDWPEGLPHLRDGSDPQLSELAGRELGTPPDTPDEQVALADAWWELARDRKAKAADRDPLLAARRLLVPDGPAAGDRFRPREAQRSPERRARAGCDVRRHSPRRAGRLARQARGVQAPRSDAEARADGEVPDLRRRR